MNRFSNCALALVSVPLGLLVATTARAASMTEVSSSTWAGSASLPNYVKMFIYVPDKLAAKPPIMVSSHSCGSTASGQMGNIPKIQAAADKNGFIIILPDNPGQNCWDVGSTQSLKHDGGGDTQAVAAMVKYALSKYSGDPNRVYAMGGSSGAMMTQALMAVYPDIFRAGHARAGVPAGCWADGYASSNQWSNNCANGTTNKTAQQWGDLVRSMFPGYTGHRPRIQLMQGESDATISYKNMGEAIEEWTNVLNLSTTPTSTDKSFKGQESTYDRQFWKNSCDFVVLETWSAPGQGHSMGYEEDAILKFFGLDTAGGTDPEPDCTGAGGGGAGGASGTGSAGAPGVGGSQPTTAVTGGTSGRGGAANGGTVSAAGRSAGRGGSGPTSSNASTVTETGGRATNGGSNTRGGSNASGGTVATGGLSASSEFANGGSAQSSSTAPSAGGATLTSHETLLRGGSSTGTSTLQPNGGSPNTDTTATAPDGNPPGGCSCALGAQGDRAPLSSVVMLAVLRLVARRRRARG